MPTFYYKAKKKNAETVMGEVIAQNQDEAIDLVSQKGFLPITMEEKLLGSDVPKIRKRGRVSLREIYMFNRQLISLLNAGVSLLRALEIISSQLKNFYFKDIIALVAFGIKGGRTLSDCLSEYPAIFSPIYVVMIRAGEESGNLKEVLKNISEYQSRQQEINSKLKVALTYPIIMILFGLGTVIFLLTFVMPKIINLFTHVNTPLPPATILLISVSEILRGYWYTIIVLLIGIIFIYRRWQRSKQGRRMLSQLGLQWPILGQVIMKVELARFSRTFALLLGSGIPILRAFQITLPILRNDVIREHLARCQNDLASGNSFGQSLKQSSLMPRMMGDLIAIGEESGSLGETLQDIADAYEQETNEFMKIMMTFLEPLLIIVVGSLIGFVVMAILLPIFQLDVLTPQ